MLDTYVRGTGQPYDQVTSLGFSTWVVLDDVIIQYMVPGEGCGGRKIMPPRFWVLRTISKPKKQKNQFAQPNRTGIHKDPH